MGIVPDWLTNLFSGSNGSGGSPSPNLPTFGSPGSTDPAIPSYGSVRSNEWGRAIGNADYGSLLGMLFGGDSSDAYNAALTRSQAARAGELNVRGWDGRGGGAGQARPGIAAAAPPDDPSASTPATAPVQLSPGMGMGGAPLPGLVPAMASGGALPVSAPASGGASPGGLGPQQIMSEIASLSSFPGGAAMVPAYLKLLETQTSGGRAIDGSGGVYRLGGADAADLREALSKDKISTAGVDPNNPNSVNMARANSAYAIERNKAMGTGLLQLGPDGTTIVNSPGVVSAAAGKAGAVKGAEEWAGVNPAAVKAQDAARAKWLSPEMLRSGTDLIAPSLLPGAPTQRMVPNWLGGPGFTAGSGGIGSAAPAAPPASAVAPPAAGAPDSTASNGLPPGVLKRNSVEQAEREKDLADQTKLTEQNMLAAKSMHDRLVEIRANAPSANLGSFAENRTAWGNFLETILPGSKIGEATTADQVIDKLTTQLAGDQTSALGQKANAALQTFKAANPHRGLTPAALNDITGILLGVADYGIAEHAARQAYITSHFGSAEGFTDPARSDFYKNNSPLKFALPYLSREALVALKKAHQ